MKNLFNIPSSLFKVQGSSFKVQPGTRNSAPAAAALCAVLALMPALAPAQGLTDPTRPAIGYADADAGVATGGPVLQSVMITPTLQSAIISGEMVKLGGKFGSARLVKISESEVVLKDGGETQILKLYPGVEKRAVEKPEAKAAAKRRK